MARYAESSLHGRWSWNSSPVQLSELRHEQEYGRIRRQEGLQCVIPIAFALQLLESKAYDVRAVGVATQKGPLLQQLECEGKIMLQCWWLSVHIWYCTEMCGVKPRNPAVKVQSIRKSTEHPNDHINTIHTVLSAVPRFLGLRLRAWVRWCNACILA